MQSEEIKNKVFTRTMVHQQDSLNEKWDSSSAAQDCLECPGIVNWIQTKCYQVSNNVTGINSEEHWKTGKTNEKRNILSVDGENFVKETAWISLRFKLVEKEKNTFT